LDARNQEFIMSRSHLFLLPLQRTSGWSRALAVAALATGAWALSSTAQEARAGDVYWSVGVHQPGVSVGVSNAPPVVVYPSYPVVVSPPVVVRPVPRVVYGPPPAVVVAPSYTAWVPPGHRKHRHWREDRYARNDWRDDRRDDWRDSRRDDDWREHRHR
jgi:hypothetical protein